MRLLFLTHYFPPEVNAPANRTFEHCREWARQGWDVHVITTIPSHPHGRPFTGYRRSWYVRERTEGITVHRIWTYLAANNGVFRRAFSYLSFVPTAIFRAVRLGKFDVIVATSPQFFCAVAGWMAARVTKTPWVFEVRDLWPDSIAAVGAVRPSLLLRLFGKLELRMYHSAMAVVCVTKSFIENLESRHVNIGKLFFVPNGVSTYDWESGDGASVRKELGLGPKTIIASYVGTVGMAHGLGTILEAAERVREKCSDLIFLIVGDGAERETLETEAKRRGLSSVIFTGLWPHERMRDVLAASDLALVLLKRSPVFEMVIPSKMFEAMASGTPIILGVEGEAKRILEESGAGVCTAPENAAALANAVSNLADDAIARKAMAEAGRTFVAQHFDRKTMALRMGEVLGEVQAMKKIPR